MVINFNDTVNINEDLINATDNIINSKKYIILDSEERKKYNAKQ